MASNGAPATTLAQKHETKISLSGKVIAGTYPFKSDPTSPFAPWGNRLLTSVSCQ